MKLNFKRIVAAFIALLLALSMIASLSFMAKASFGESNEDNTWADDLDVNEDGIISVTDAVIIRRVILNKENSYRNKIRADVNKDEAVNVTDLTLVIEDIMQ